MTVSCHRLDVTKNATTAFTRTRVWALDKTADQTELTLSPGQSFDVTYWVEMTAEPVDSDWAASGDVWIANSRPTRAAGLVAVTDSMSGGIDAAVDCPSLVVPAAGSLHCTYTADLPDGSARTNTATATLQNVSIASDGTVTASGTTGFDSGGVAVVFGDPDTVIDACVDVDDSLEGALGTVCAADAPASFHYPHSVGPYESPEGRGTHEVVNVGSFVAGDTGTAGEDSWTVTVTVPCPPGCTLTPGYWKTHSEHGPAPYDDTWAELPAGADTAFFLSGQSWDEVLWTAPKGNAYHILGRAYAATSRPGTEVGLSDRIGSPPGDGSARAPPAPGLGIRHTNDQEILNFSMPTQRGLRAGLPALVCGGRHPDRGHPRRGHRPDRAFDPPPRVSCPAPPSRWSGRP